MTHLATAKDKIVATTQGGAHKSKVTVSSNPISLTNAGKKKLKLRERLMLEESKTERLRRCMCWMGEVVKEVRFRSRLARTNG